MTFAFPGDCVVYKDQQSFFYWHSQERLNCMEYTTSVIKARLDHIANIYAKIDEIIDSIPIKLPHSLQTKLKHILFTNEDIADLVDGIKNRRPPRFILVGRSGAGKSSLINALAGRYLAKTSDVVVGTTKAQKFEYTSQGKTLFEIIDTRGFSESAASPIDSRAEDQLHDAIHDFQPDAILFIKRCKERDGLDKDVEFLKNIITVLNDKVPVCLVLTQADEMEPSREKNPTKYPISRLDNITKAEQQIRDLLIEKRVRWNFIVSASSLIEWSQEPDKVNPELWPELTIEFDGRFRIDELLRHLDDNITTRAAIFLMLASKMDEVSKRMCERLVKAFSLAAAALATTPIPLSELPILLALHSALVMIIAYLGGQEMSFESAKKVLMTLSGVGAVGFTTQILAQQGSKFFNAVFPGAGSFISAGMASLGTYTVGRGAIKLYVN